MMSKLSASALALMAMTQTASGAGTDEWKQRAVYQVLTDRFSKNDDSSDACTQLSNYCGGTFKGIENNLDYI